MLSPFGRTATRRQFIRCRASRIRETQKASTCPGHVTGRGFAGALQGCGKAPGCCGKSFVTIVGNNHETGPERRCSIRGQPGGFTRLG